MIIGVPKERLSGESRVAATPKTVEQLQKLGFKILIEKGAGVKASFDDDAFVQAGAAIAETAGQVWQSDIILKVNTSRRKER